MAGAVVVEDPGHALLHALSLADGAFERKDPINGTFDPEVRAGRGRLVALCCRASSLYQICKEIRHCFRDGDAAGP